MLDVKADTFSRYLAGQIPSNMILSKVRPSIYMAGKKT